VRCEVLRYRYGVELLIRCQGVLVSYVIHARAGLNPVGRLKLVQLVINQGWTHTRIAQRFQVSQGEGVSD